jgi:hypothetical protein
LLELVKVFIEASKIFYLFFFSPRHPKKLKTSCALTKSRVLFKFDRPSNKKSSGGPFPSSMVVVPDPIVYRKFSTGEIWTGFEYCILTMENCSVADPGCSRIPDPGPKKIPDLGSGSIRSRIKEFKYF